MDGEYSATTPVAAGQIQAVPEPSSWAGILAFGAMGTVYGLKNRKNRRKSAFDNTTAPR